MSKDKLVTVATFPLPQDAYVIRTRLEAEGIYSFLKDEFTVQTDNFLSNAIGGVKLQIRESEVERAIPLLVEAGVIEKQHTISKHETPGSFPRELKIVLISGAIISTLIFLIYFLLQQ